MKTLLFLWSFAVAALAQTTPAELKEAKAEHAKADASLNTAYQAAIAALEVDAQKTLREDQRDWIKYRDAIAQAQVSQNGDDPAKPEKSSAYWSMLAGLSDERTEWLGSFSKVLPAGLTGAWTDSHGGRVELQERQDGVAFNIDVARGKAPNLGSIAGLAAKTKTGAKYVEKVPAGEDRPACLVTFTLAAATGVLTVKSENSDPFHGHTAFFDGDYRKVSKLKKPVSTDGGGEDGKK